MEKDIILVSHGKLSEGMYDSVKMIIGDVSNLYYFSLLAGEDNNAIYDRVLAHITEKGNKQYIIVADLLGGSVSNAVSRLSTMDNVIIINGMNMGLVISLLLTPELEFDDIDKIIYESREGICLTNLNNDYNISSEEDI